MADCPDGTKPVTLDNGAVACVGHILVTCAPPQVRVCSPTLPYMPVCRCELPKVTCEVLVTYQANDALAAQVAITPGCDAATAHLALTMALAKLLQNSIPQP